MSEIATQQKAPGLREMLSSPNVKTGIKKALGGFMDEDNFLAQMLIAFQAPGTEGRPGVVDCSIDSKFKAAHVCATLGLLPTLGQVALIPRDMKGQGLTCTVMPQWQGFQALMLRHPDVKTVKATLIHVSDSYKFDPETESIIDHTYDPFDEKRKFTDFKDLRGGYLVVTFKDNRQKLYHCVKLDVFTRARGCAITDKIWSKWFEEQCLKTIYRNAYARRVVPIDPFATQRLQALVESEDEALGNDPDRVITVPATAITYTPEIVDKPKSRTEAVSQKMKKPDPPQEQQPETEPPAKTSKAAKDKAKPEEIPFDVQIVKAETTEQVDAIFEAVKAAGLSEEEVSFYRNIANKRVESLMK